MTQGAEAAAARREPIAHQKMGMWFFLGSEVMFFAGLISMFVHFKIVDPAASDVLDVGFTAVNTLVLLTSSFTMVRGLSAIRDNDRRGLWVNMIATGFLGLIFLMGQALEFSKLAFEGTGLNSIFGSTFFILTGFHGLHVFIGILWIVYILARVYKANIWNAGHQMQVEIFGLYWHFVDVVWVILFTVIYLIR